MSPQAPHLVPLHECLMIAPFKMSRCYDDTASSESEDNLRPPSATSRQHTEVRRLDSSWGGAFSASGGVVMFPLMADRSSPGEKQAPGLSSAILFGTNVSPDGCSSPNKKPQGVMHDPLSNQRG